eukprot:gene14855-biopygen9670
MPSRSAAGALPDTARGPSARMGRVGAEVGPAFSNGCPGAPLSDFFGARFGGNEARARGFRRMSRMQRFGARHGESYGTSYGRAYGKSGLQAAIRTPPDAHSGGPAVKPVGNHRNTDNCGAVGNHYLSVGPLTVDRCTLGRCMDRRLDAFYFAPVYVIAD